MSAVLKQQQYQLLFPEHSLYLVQSRPATHFAVLWRDPALRNRAVEARKSAELLQCHIDYLYDKNPEHEHIPVLRADLAAEKKQYFDKRQACYAVADLPLIIQALPKDRDTWISQSLFNTAKSGYMSRRKVHFSSCSVLFADLDYYKIGHFSDPDEALACALRLIESAGWPAPSIALFSGRGIYLKWIFATPLPRPALPRWEAAERAIIKLLSTVPGLGVDASVKDISRVLRLENSLHEKSGETVRVLWINEQDGQPKQYDFEQLIETMLPYSKEEVLAFRSRDKARAEADVSFRQEWANKGEAAKAIYLAHSGEKPHGLRPLSGRHLAWDRMLDLEALAQMRGWDTSTGGQGVARGFRSRFVFWYLNFMGLAGDLTPLEFWGEVVATIDRFAPDLLRTRDKSIFYTLRARLQKFLDGEAVEHKGERYPALYTPRNQTLADFFQITAEEERNLKTIISEDEARRRDAERARRKRQEAGGKTRQGYLACGEQKRASAQLMRAQGKSWQEVAEALGYSNGEAARRSCTLKAGKTISRLQEEPGPEKVRPYY
jgi:hypothetical protein